MLKVDQGQVPESGGPRRTCERHARCGGVRMFGTLAGVLSRAQMWRGGLKNFEYYGRM